MGTTNKKETSSLTLTGPVIEVGNIDAESGPGFVIDRGNSKYAAVFGLTEDEVRGLAGNYGKQLTIAIGSGAVGVAPDVGGLTEIAGVNIERLMRNLDDTSYNEGSEALACRLSDCREVISALLATKAAAEAVPQQAVPDGRKLVPPEMDWNMQRAWEGINNHINADEMHAIYRAMLAAAPVPPVPAPAELVDSVFRFENCTVSLSSIAGNQAPGGFLSTCSLLVENKDGTWKSIEYRAAPSEQDDDESLFWPPKALLKREDWDPLTRKPKVPVEQPSTSDQAHVMPPFAAPAGEHEANRAADDQWIFDLAADHETRGNGLYGPVTFSATGLANFAHTIEALVASRCRAQGGNTCEKCGGKGYNFTGVIGEPPEECEACFDQQPDDLAHVARQPAAATAERAAINELLTRIDDANENYERFGQVCEFEGHPMIYASTLHEIIELRGKAHVASLAAPSPAAAQEGEQGSVRAEPYAYEHDNGTCSELVYAEWFERGGVMKAGDIYRPLYLRPSAARSSTEASAQVAPDEVLGLLEQSAAALEAMLNKRGYGCGEGSDHQVEMHNERANKKAVTAVAAIRALRSTSTPTEGAGDE